MRHVHRSQVNLSMASLIWECMNENKKELSGTDRNAVKKGT